MTPPKDEPQTAIDERIVEDSELDAALENREQARGAKLEAQAAFKTKDAVVKDKLEQLGIDDGEAVRVGSFRITASKAEPKDVAYTTNPSLQLSISRDSDE